MAWSMIGKPQTVKVDKALAERFAKMEPAGGDRQIKAWRVKSYQTAMVNGTFRTCEWAQAKCKENGKTYRVNGKHTSHAMVGMNGSMPKSLYVIVEEYECDTLEDVARLYATFDSKKGVRSTGDINQSFAASVPALADVGSKIINLSVTGISYATWGIAGSSRVDADVRASLVNDNANFVLLLRETIGNPCRSTSHVTRAAVVAAMYLTWQKAKQASTTFWTAVKDGSGADHNSPDRVLNKWLLQTSSKIHYGTVTHAKMAGVHEMMVRCLHAWNAYRKGENTALRYFKDCDIPKAS